MDQLNQEKKQLKWSDFMGGREGARGYLYQAVVAVINSLSDSKWEKVTLEPSTKMDKVDILWEYSNGFKKVTQVKSSNNKFDKSTIVNILKGLIKDVPSAEEYELILVGELSKSALLLKEQFDKSIYILDTEFQDYMGKIKIKPEPYSFGDFENKIYREVDKLVYSYNRGLSPDVKELQVKALIYQFLSFSTIGQTFLRTELINWFTNKDSNNFYSADLRSIILYAFSQIERLFETSRTNKTEIIQQLGEVNSIIEKRLTEECEIFTFDFILEKDFFYFMQINTIEERDKYISKLSKDDIFIPAGTKLVGLLISTLLHLLGCRNNINEDMVDKFIENNTKKDLILSMINENQIYSFYDGKWMNYPLQEVW